LGKKGRERVRRKGKKRNIGPVLQWLMESGGCGSVFPREIVNFKKAQIINRFREQFRDDRFR
jgi:hypothetical protein